jgi:deoxyribonuclease-4
VDIGAHVPNEDPLAEAAARGADCIQIFLSNPQGWKAPVARADAAALRASPLPIYVHAPYIINVASGNNRIRIPSRKNLEQTCRGAEAIGAAGVIVHGGHVAAADEVDEGFARWRKCLEQLETSVPLLIENTAGGDFAMSRHIDTIARLWDVLDGIEVGFCLDTCHAHAAGEELVDCVDRHENLGAGKIKPELMIEVIRAAGAPVICETPGETAEHAADIQWLRERL